MFFGLKQSHLIVMTMYATSLFLWLNIAHFYKCDLFLDNNNQLIIWNMFYIYTNSLNFQRMWYLVLGFVFLSYKIGILHESFVKIRSSQIVLVFSYRYGHSTIKAGVNLGWLCRLHNREVCKLFDKANSFGVVPHSYGVWVVLIIEDETMTALFFVCLILCLSVISDGFSCSFTSIFFITKSTFITIECQTVTHISYRYLNMILKVYAGNVGIIVVNYSKIYVCLLNDNSSIFSLYCAQHEQIRKCRLIYCLSYRFCKTNNKFYFEAVNITICFCERVCCLMSCLLFFVWSFNNGMFSPSRLGFCTVILINIWTFTFSLVFCMRI